MGAVSAETYYEIHEPLGAGGAGVVYRATIRGGAGQRLVAIKRLLNEDGNDLRASARLLAEARLVFQLTHANICQIVDVAAHDDGLFLVMEYVEGIDLYKLRRSLKKQGKTIDVASAVHVTREVARALDYAYRRRDANGARLCLCHGDVSPRNILLSVEGEVKLADFGIARGRVGASPGRGVRGGTPGFVAPEVAGAGPDHRSDIYSLGRCLRYALGESHATETDMPNSRRVGADLAGVVGRATHRDPMQRFESAGQLERELATIIARRFPTFTPSDLATVTSAHHTPAPQAVDSVVARLDSLTRATATVPEVPAALALAEPETRTVHSASKRRSRLAWLSRAAAIAMVIAIAVSLVVLLKGRTKGKPSVAAASTTPTRDGSVPEQQPSQPEELATAAPASAKKPQPRRRSPKSRARRKREPAKKASAESKPPGRLTVSASPWGAVYVDGKRVSAETPLVAYPLAPGPHVLKVFFPTEGVYSKERTVNIKPGKPLSVTFRK